MNKLFTVTIRDIIEILTSSRGYIAIPIFSALLGVVYSSELLTTGTLNLNNFFRISPIIAIFFVSVITMQSWSEEFNKGTIDLIRTIPVSNPRLLISKFLSTFVVSFIGISPILFFQLLLNLFAKPDNLQLITSFIGLMLVVLLANIVGNTISLLSTNQITVFVMSILTLLVWYLISESTILIYLNGPIYSIFDTLGIVKYYLSITKGIIDTRDVLYFIFAIFSTSMIYWRTYISKLTQ